MTDQTPIPTPPGDVVPFDDAPTTTELSADERAAMAPGKPEPVDAPDDVADDVATGYAVYDRTLGRFVTPVSTDKPSSSDARKAVAKGHSYATVRV